MASAWIQHVKSFYQKKKKEDPSYKYSQAMKEARSTYKKKGSAAPAAEPAKPKRKRRRAKKKAPSK